MIQEMGNYEKESKALRWLIAGFLCLPFGPYAIALVLSIGCFISAAILYGSREAIVDMTVESTNPDPDGSKAKGHIKVLWKLTLPLAITYLILTLWTGVPMIMPVLETSTGADFPFWLPFIFFFLL